MSIIRVVAVLLAGTIAAGCTGCSSSDGSADTARKDAKAFTCPAAAGVSAALGKSVPAGKRSTTADRTVICSYTAPDLDADAFVAVTFGATAGDYTVVLRGLAGSSTTPVPGLGDTADAFSKDGTGQLLVRSGSRVISVTATPSGSETAIARLFLR